VLGQNAVSSVYFPYVACINFQFLSQRKKSDPVHHVNILEVKVHSGGFGLADSRT
jgi:hypothetical protein